MSAPAILYLTGSYPEWSETFIVQELRLLHKSGLLLFPVAITHGTGSVPVDLPPFKYLCRKTEKPRISGHSGTIFREYPSFFHKPWLRGTWRRRASLVRHVGELKRLIGCAKQHNIQHLHAAFGALPGLLVSAAARWLNLSYSISVHAADVMTSKIDDAFLFDQAQFVFTCNHRVHDALLERCPLLKGRVHLAHHGLILDEWPLAKQEFQPDGPLRLLFVHNLV